MSEYINKYISVRNYNIDRQADWQKMLARKLNPDDCGSDQKVDRTPDNDRAEYKILP